MNSVANHYEQFLAEHYTWMSGGHAVQVEKNRELLERFGVAGSAGGKALDLGCGSGFQALALAELGYSVVAVDASQRLLDELSGLATGRAVAVVCGDMLDSSTYDVHAPFDVVVCMGDTLVHAPTVESVGRLFRDICARLRPGGKLLLSFRDLSAELEGIERAIPVRLDEHALMATFLEYSPSHVKVHDMLFTREGEAWRMSKSAYRKLRLSAGEATTALGEAGFVNVDKCVERGFTVIAAEKPR